MNWIEKQINSGVLPDMEIVCCLDGHEPRLAPLVIETISEVDELTISLIMGFACGEAYESISRN